MLAVDVVDPAPRAPPRLVSVAGPGDTTRSCRVMITAVDTSIPPIQSWELNADTADTAASSGVRRI
jgi:hypothetical protein